MAEAHKSFVPLSVYLDRETSQKLAEVAETMNNSRSGAAELLIKRALGLMSDMEIEDIISPRQKKGTVKT